MTCQAHEAWQSGAVAAEMQQAHCQLELPFCNQPRVMPEGMLFQIIIVKTLTGKLWTSESLSAFCI